MSEFNGFRAIQENSLIASLRAIMAIADKLMTCPDVDTLFRNAVMRCRDGLKVERCAIFVEDGEGYMQGTYGTDRHGQTTDERMCRFPKNEVWAERLRLLGPQDPRWMVVEEPHFEWDGERTRRIGAGWIAVTPIQSSRRSIGVFVNDAAISGAPVDAEKQEVVAIFCSLLGSIVERKWVEEALRERERNYRSLIETAGSVIICLSPDGRILELNRAAEDILGWQRQEVLAQDFFELFLPDTGRSAVAMEINKILAGEPTKDFENTLLTRSGGERVLLWNATRLLDASGQPVSIIGIGQDITERKRTEKELERSHEQLRDLTSYLQSALEKERTQIAREIHDELGQGLTALKMDLFWLDRRLPQDQRSLREKVKAMSDLIDTIIGAVRRIVSTLRPGVLDDLGLVAAIEWQAREFHHRTGIEYELTISPQEIAIEGDLATAVFRIFQETLTNIARHADASKVEICLQEEGGYLVSEVRDNGRGITPAQVNNPKSLGLLGIRERALLRGGEVTVNGLPGQGTVVTVKMPIENAGKTGED